MKIFYDKPVSTADVSRRLQKSHFASGRGKEKIRVYQKEDSLFLEIDRGRMATVYKLIVTEEYVKLKYSGFFSYMNIFLGIFWGILPMLLSVVMIILTILAKDVYGTGRMAQEILQMVGLFGIAIILLWIFVISFRISARKYIEKVLKL